MGSTAVAGRRKYADKRQGNIEPFGKPARKGERPSDVNKSRHLRPMKKCHVSHGILFLKYTIRIHLSMHAVLSLFGSCPFLHIPHFSFAQIP